MKRTNYILFIIGLAFLLRLVYILLLDISSIASLSGDGFWYLTYGAGVMSGVEGGILRGLSYTAANIPSAPLYLIFVGIPQQFLSYQSAIICILIIQVILSTAICYFVYRITYQISRHIKAAEIAAFLIAISPVFIIDSSRIMTETLYMFFVSAALWLMIEYVLPGLEHPQGRRYMLFIIILTGILCGLATLTRAVFLLYPIGLVIYLLMFNRKRWRRSLLLSLVLLLTYSITIGTWTAYNLWQFDRFVIVSNQFMPAVWRGAVITDGSPVENDDQLLATDTRAIDCEIDCDAAIRDKQYIDQTRTAVFSNIVAYLRLRLSELLNANLLPYGLVEAGGESLRVLLIDWLSDDFTGTGFLKLLNGDNFWLKLLHYLFHYSVMVMGIMGIWLTRKRWKYTIVPVSVIIYTLLIHTILIAEARYMFPAQFVWYIFTGITLYAVLRRITRQYSSEGIQ